MACGHTKGISLLYQPGERNSCIELSIRCRFTSLRFWSLHCETRSPSASTLYLLIGPLPTLGLHSSTEGTHVADKGQLAIADNEVKFETPHGC